MAVGTTKHGGGFTLVELLVVIAVIALLVLLLLPAVQAARGAARRTQCLNNLKQIGLAIQNHESARRRYPAGYLSYGDYGTITSLPAGHYDSLTWDATPGWGWGAQILPYLEESVLHDRIDLNRPFWDPEYRNLIQRQLPVFLCPSVSGADGPFELVDDAGAPLTIDGSTITVARSHYVVNHGQEECWADCSGPMGTLGPDNGDVSLVADGPFYRNSRVRQRDITDGLSKTVFAGEHTSKLSDKTWVGAAPGAYVHPKIASPDNAAETAATLLLAHSGPAAGEVDALGNPIIHPPNFPTLHVGQMMSEHPGGAHIVLGDGAVAFFSEDTNRDVFAALSSIAEGDEVGEY